MEKLKSMKEALMTTAQTQIAGNLANVNAEELGEVIDMIKDLEEAIYYCTVVKAMEDSEKNHEMEDKFEKYQQRHQMSTHYQEPISYNRPMYYSKYPDYRDMDRDYGRMYYPGMNYDRMYYNGGGSQGGNGSNSASANSSGGTRYDMMDSYPLTMRDSREGKSPMSRKMYMESKEMHKDKVTQMKELEKYMQELSHDLTEMIQDASPEEKQLLQQKVAALATKIK